MRFSALSCMITLYSLLGSSSPLHASESISREELRRPPTRFILSIDGGGIRGLLPALLLDWVEEELITQINQHFPKEAPRADMRLGEVFDLLAGTSTGGLITLGLSVPDEATGRPRYSLKTFIDLYQTKGSAIFPSKSGWGLFKVKYSPQVLEDILTDYFKEYTLKDLLKPTLITSYDLQEEDLFLFNSSHAHHSRNKNYPLVKVARATSAAPTYLPAIDVQETDGQVHTLVDGGVAANNPSVLAYLEAQTLYPQDRLCVISLGCGSAPIFTLESIREGGKLNWAGDISSVLMNTSSSMTHHLMDQLAKQRGDQYIRVQFNLDQTKSGLDNANTDNIQALKGYAKREIKDPHSPIHKVKQVLLNFYRSQNYYLFFPFIQQLEQQLAASPTTLDLTNIFLNERALWEGMHSLQSKGQHLSLTHLILEGQPLTPALLSWLSPVKNLEVLSLKRTDAKASLAELLPVLNTLQRNTLSKLVSLDLQQNASLSKVSGSELDFLLKPYTHVELDGGVCKTLGDYYFSQKKEEQAAQWYRQGLAEKSNQLALATLLLRTQDNSAALQEGFTLIQGLADQGEQEAQYMLGHLYAKLEAEIKVYLLHHQLLTAADPQSLRTQAYQQAGYWYQLAADKNHKRAALALATLYREHHVTVSALGIEKGEQRQLEEAAKYYRIASAVGSESSQRLLQEVLQEIDQIKRLSHQ